MAEMAVQGLLEFWPCKSVNNPNFGLPIVSGGKLVVIGKKHPENNGQDWKNNGQPRKLYYNKRNIIVSMLWFCVRQQQNIRHVLGLLAVRYVHSRFFENIFSVRLLKTAIKVINFTKKATLA